MFVEGWKESGVEHSSPPEYHNLKHCLNLSAIRPTNVSRYPDEREKPSLSEGGNRPVTYSVRVFQRPACRVVSVSVSRFPRHSPSISMP